MGWGKPFYALDVDRDGLIQIARLPRGCEARPRTHRPGSIDILSDTHVALRHNHLISFIFPYGLFLASALRTATIPVAGGGIQ